MPEVIALSKLTADLFSAIHNHIAQETKIIPALKLYKRNRSLQQRTKQQRPRKHRHNAFLPVSRHPTAASPYSQSQNDKRPHHHIVHADVNQIHHPRLQPPKCRQNQQTDSRLRQAYTQQTLIRRD